jgi:3-hydroxyisobutyrate dehydrogenase-like beta-hydroxyacid dehydrogenase
MGTTNDQRVAVLGCGNMGSALARTLAAAGRDVTVWNRTHERAEALAGGRVTAARSAADAVAAAHTVLACVSVYGVLRELRPSLGDMSGKTLINLTTGSPGEAEEMASWAQSQGIGYLDGVITVYPRQIGNRDAQIMVSGPTELWQAHESLLLSLAGGARHVSQSPGLANVLDVSLVGAFYIAALTSFIEASAFALGSGVTPDMLLASALPVIDLLKGAVEEAVEHISTGKADVHDASVAVFGEAARAMSAEIRHSGHSALLLDAAARIITDAEKAGLGGLSLAAVTRVLRPAE